MIRRALAAACAIGAIAPASASAHATIVETSPPDTAVVRTPPASVSLTWSEPVDLGARAVRLLDGSGRALRTAPPRHRGRATAVLTLPRPLANGTYVVAWRVASSDSHPVSGAFSFSIGAPSAVAFHARGGSDAAVRALDAVGRGLAFLGLALALGGAVVVFGLWSDGAADPRARLALGAGVSALLAGSLLVLLLQGPYATGDSLLGVFKPSLISFSLSTRFGHALVVRILLALALAGLIGLAARRGRSPALTAGAVACGLGLILTWTLVDHSSTGVQTGLGVPVGSVHLLAMALWFGGLLVLLACLPPAAVVGRFSRLALVCFTVLALSGLYLAYRQSGDLGALPGTVFGRLLLVKAAIVAAIVGLAYLSRRAVARAGSVRRTVAGEAFLGVAVLGVTAALVNTAPARVAYVDPIKTTVAGPDGGRIQVKIHPAKQGQNVTDVFLERRDGTLLEVPELTARLLPPGGRSGPLNVAFGPAEPGHYVADRMTVPYPGRWTLRLQIRTSEIDESDVDLPVRIR